MKIPILTLQKSLPYILIIAGAIGVIFSFIITYNHMQMLENPSFIPSCNLNPIIACGDRKSVV